MYGVAGQGWLFWLGIPVMSLWGLSGPSIQGLMTRRVQPDEQGQLQGAIGSLRGITGMIGPTLFTATFAAFITTRRSLQLPGAPFFIASALLATAIMFSFWVTCAQAPPEPLSEFATQPIETSEA